MEVINDKTVYKTANNRLAVIAYLKHREGLILTQSKGYIGYGCKSTLKRITKPQADSLLEAKFQIAVSICCKAHKNISLNQLNVAAIFVYCLGEYKYKHSELFKQISNGEMPNILHYQKKIRQFDNKRITYLWNFYKIPVIQSGRTY